MGVSNPLNRKDRSANGVLTDFDFDFLIFADSDLLVYDVDADGAATLKTLTTDYTVSISDTVEGGTVTFLSAPTDGHTIRMIGAIPITQGTEFPLGTGFSERNIRTALDKVTRLCSQLKDLVDLTVSVPISGDPGDTITPEALQTLVDEADADAAAAAASASAASSSASSASSSASTATSSKNAAQSAQTAAEAAQSAAEAAQTAAEAAQSAVEAIALPSYGAGDVLIASSDGSLNVTDTSYTKRKSIKVPRGGSLRIKFTLTSGGGSGGSVEGRIYRNGVAVGTAQSLIYTGGTATYSEDIAGWSAQDEVQIYAKKTTGITSPTLTNFRIYADTVSAETVVYNA